MATARRLYLYIVSAIALGLLLNGASTLLRLIFDQLGFGPVSTLGNYAFNMGSGTGLHPEREALSGAIALIIVGLPLWLIHWGFLERLVRGDGAEADVERRSIARSVFFAVVLIELLTTFAGAGVDLVREGLGKPLGATDPYPYSPANLSNSMSLLIAGGAVWLYHGWARVRDTRQSSLRGAAAWISRLYLYGAAMIGIWFFLTAVGSVVATVGDLVAGRQAANSFLSGYNPGDFYPGYVAPTAAWWVRPILAASAQIVVWTPLWLGHWLFSVRLCSRNDETGVSERKSRVRLTYLAGVAVLGAGYAVFGFGQGLGALLGWVVGSTGHLEVDTVWRDIAVPALAVVPAIAAWMWHRCRAMAEGAALAPDDAAASPVRVFDHLTALVGLAYFAAGLAMFLGLIVQRSMAGSGLTSSADDWRWQAVQAAAIAVVALPVWLWPWLASLQRAISDPLGEARRTSRRAYLYVAVGATLVSAAGMAAWIVYRIVRAVVGLESPQLGPDVGYALGALIAIVPVLAYHAMVLRADLTLMTGDQRPLPDSGAAAAAVTPARVHAAEVARGAMQELVIVGPAGADLETVRASIADRLPAGYSVLVRAVSEELDPNPN